jgi:hypothetical protein
MCQGEANHGAQDSQWPWSEVRNQRAPFQPRFASGKNSERIFSLQVKQHGGNQFPSRTRTTRTKTERRTRERSKIWLRTRSGSRSREGRLQIWGRRTGSGTGLLHETEIEQRRQIDKAELTEARCGLAAQRITDMVSPPQSKLPTKNSRLISQLSRTRNHDSDFRRNKTDHASQEQILCGSGKPMTKTDSCTIHKLWAKKRRLSGRTRNSKILPPYKLNEHSTSEIDGDPATDCWVC